MKKLFIILAISLFSLISCKEDPLSTNEKICDYEDPVKDLEWLKLEIDNHLINSSQQSALIDSYTYNGKDVFYLDMCTIGCADFMTVIKNCEGEVICQKGGIAGLDDCPDFEEKAKKIRNIWTYNIENYQWVDAAFTGIDFRLCACCGGRLFEINGKEYMDKGNFVNQYFSNIKFDLSQLPINVKIKFAYPKVNCMNNEIIILDFKFN